jgi:hypothetical protein
MCVFELCDGRWAFKFVGVYYITVAIFHNRLSERVCVCVRAYVCVCVRV